MDHFARSVSYTEEQKEQIYCSPPQDLEDIVCDGSDAEQTAEQIIAKRRRYEEIGRKYLSGSRPLIQSASLRGPLDRESGWVNPWRFLPRREAGWWQPGSEEMLFTRENVMKRAADHGLGYLNPTEALAWCKAAADTEAREHFDSLDVAYCSAGSASGVDGEGDGSPIEDLPHLEEEHHIGHDPPTNSSARYGPAIDSPAEIMRGNDSTNSNTKGLKRPADAKWLKGSCVSKRARWEDTPLSSPTPLPDLLSERNKRRREVSAKVIGLQNQRHDPTSEPINPWLQDAQQWGPGSWFTGSRAQGQGLGSKDNGRHLALEAEARAEDMDELHEVFPKTLFVSAPESISGSQAKTKLSRSTSRPSLDLEPDDLMATLTRDTSFDNLAERSGAPIRRSATRSNELPVLPRNSKTRVVADLGEDISFATEVAPSSRNLERFHFKKKRRKSREHQAKESRKGSGDLLRGTQHLSEPALSDRGEDLTHEASVTPDPIQQLADLDQAETVKEMNHNVPVLDNQARPSPESDAADMAEELDEEACLTIDPVDQAPLKSPDDRLNADIEKVSHKLPPLRLTSSPEEALIQMQRGATSPGNRQSDESYFKKIALISVNMLPNLHFSSPFALFGPSGANKPTPTKASPLEHRPILNVSEYVDNDLVADPNLRTDRGPDLKISEELTSDWHEDVVDTIGPTLMIMDDIDHGTSLDSIEHVSTDAALASPTVTDEEQKLIAAPTSASEDIQKSFSQRLQAAATDDQFIYTETLSQAVGASTSPLGILQRECGASQHANDLLAVPPTELSHHAAVRSQATPECKERIANLTQDPSIDDGSTQSLNNTPPKSSRKAWLSAQFDPISHRRTSPVLSRDRSDIVLDASSQNDQGSSSSDSGRSYKSLSLQQPPAATKDQEPSRTIPLAPYEDENRARPDDEQRIWQGYGPQSPWAPETILPLPTDRVKLCSETLHSATDDSFMHIASSSPHAQNSIGLTVERPSARGNVEVKPLRDTVTPVCSPQYPEISTEHEEASNAQQLMEAATNNPWASNSTKRGSGKIKKRVSFGDVPSEEKAESQPKTSSSKLGLRSPPLAQTSDRPRDEKIFDDYTPVVSKFGKHFSAAARLRHTLPRNNGSVLRSPAVGAMAERFIAADQETSLDRGQRPDSEESPTHHLKPTSDSRTNLSPDITGYDLEVNLDAFLGDAGVLNDWSVESEVKKVKESRGMKDCRSATSKRRGFELTSVWS